jgi:hypothetical protein
MGSLREELLSIERELAAGSGDSYRRFLTDDAMVIVPGMVLDREGCASAIDSGPRWDAWTISDERLLELAPDVAVLTYRWRSKRGETSYLAAMTSVYTKKKGDGWRLVLHQQTPEPHVDR